MQTQLKYILNKHKGQHYILSGLMYFIKGHTAKRNHWIC